MTVFYAPGILRCAINLGNERDKRGVVEDGLESWFALCHEVCRWKIKCMAVIITTWARHSVNDCHSLAKPIFWPDCLTVLSARMMVY